MSTITLITGGARSGKSRYALERAMKYERRGFIATAEPVDDEMRIRIERHRKERGAAYLTVEEPLDIAAAVSAMKGTADVALVDCLTVWLGNLMHAYPEVKAAECAEYRSFLRLAEAAPLDLIIVTNEVGMGIVPPSELGREFRDAAGMLNQESSRRADTVVFMVSGLPLYVKGNADE